MADWVPKTRLGQMVLNGEITTMSDALATKLPLREPEIVDILLPDLKDEVIDLNMVQRMTDSGRRVRFAVTCIVGNGDGFIGIGRAKGKEVGPSIKKAIDNAKLNMIEIKRGCGSWQCGCGQAHSLPFEVVGTTGSVTVSLKPAPRGVSLAVGDVAKSLLTLAGVNDAWGFARGNTKTKVNYAMATFDALRMTSRMRVTDEQAKTLNIVSGPTGVNYAAAAGGVKMAYVVIRVRGIPDVNRDIAHTMDLLGLNRVNHAVVVPETDSIKGMLQKAKDYVTWGEVDQETLAAIIRARGRVAGDDSVTDDYLKERSEFATVEDMAKAIIENDYRMKDVDGAKPVFRLHPPVKGYEGNKRSFQNGGALGYRGAKINDLINRML